ncbi:presqualene diphosphate synthase HpnD [Neisseria sp. Ec49-e6-T10]
MNPQEYCLQKVKQSGSSFVTSFFLLSKPKREAMVVLYAFCREVDDIVDDCTDIQVAQTTLNWWREQISLVFSGQADHPVCQALIPIVQSFKLPEEEFLAIIDGMQMDLQQVRYESFEQLNLYCYRVAGVVGRLSARIFGFGHEQTLLYAQKLGLALQLTNIIRDVGEDIRIGRIYLPEEELKQFAVTQEQLLSYHSDQNFEALMKFQVARAKQTYQEALDLLPKEDYQHQKVGLTMASVYYGLLEELELDGLGKVLQQKLSLSTSRKLFLIIKSMIFGFKL